MSMSNIAIVGISADPPTKGHIALAKAVKETGYFNEVWLMPCNNHMFGKELTSSKHRLKMCEIAVEEFNIRVSDFEIKSNSEGIAYNNINALKKLYPECKFHLVIGMDNAYVITKWMHSEKLIEEVPFWVLERKGIEINPEVDWFKQGHHTHLKVELPETSSTHVRELIRIGNSRVTDFISDKVYKYILDNNLYKELSNETADPIG